MWDVYMLNWGSKEWSFDDEVYYYVDVLHIFGQYAGWVKGTRHMDLRELFYLDKIAPRALELYGDGRVHCRKTIPRTISNCLEVSRLQAGAKRLQRGWRQSINNPTYRVCRQRVLHLFHD